MTENKEGYEDAISPINAAPESNLSNELPKFKQEDPRLEGIKAKLDLLPYKRKEEIKGLFRTDLGRQRARVVAIRSQDILTTLDQLATGSIDLTSTGSAFSIMSKTQGWFYTMGNFENAYFKAHPELIPSYYEGEDFYKIALENTALYAATIAFSTFLYQNVVPVMKENWFETMRDTVVKYAEERAKGKSYPRPLVWENFISLLEKEIEEIPARYKGDKAATHVLTSRFGNRGFKALRNMLRKGVEPKEVVLFLLKASEERGGMIIGFTDKLLEQGKVLTNAAAKPEKNVVLHGDYELAIRPKIGKIDLSSGVICAIEPLGVYEDVILTGLGIVS